MTADVPVTVRPPGQLGPRPVIGEVEVIRETVPVKPPDGVMVTVELPEAPELKSAGEEALIVKSPTGATAVTVAATLTALDAVPTVPVTVTV